MLNEKEYQLLSHIFREAFMAAISVGHKDKAYAIDDLSLKVGEAVRYNPMQDVDGTYLEERAMS